MSSTPEQSLAFLTQTLDALSTHIAVLDRQGVILHVNAAWRRFGEANGLLVDKHAVGRNYIDACLPNKEGCIEDDEIIRGLRSVLDGQLSEFTREYPCHSPTERRWFLMRIARFDQAGRIMAVVAHDDITARTLAEEALRESEGRFRFLSELDEATRGLREPEKVMEMTARMLGIHLNASRCAYAEVGDDGDRFSIRHDYVAEGFASTVGEYSLNLFGVEAVTAMRSRRTLILEDIAAQLAEDDGAGMFSAIGINAIVCCPLVKEGRLTAMMAVHQGVAREWTAAEVHLMEVVAERSWSYIERARFDRELRESEQQLRELTDAIPQQVWTSRSDGGLDYINAQTRAYAGDIPRIDGVVRWTDVVHADDLARSTEAWMSSLATGAPYEIEQRIFHRESGNYRWHLSRAKPVRNESGQITKWFGTNTEIDDRKRAEAAVAKARDEAEAANRMKDEFLGTLSHELRTPLSAVLGWVKILRSGIAEEGDLEEGLAAIERNAAAQAKIIEDLLDISRIVSGNFRLEVQPVNIQELIESALASVLPAASARNVRIQKILDSLVGPVTGDPARLQQVVWNLLSNAVKFTPKGGKIQVLLERVNSHIEISVIDTGIGIKPEFLPHVFDRFRQADGSTTRRHGGLGLGLSIVKQLVELHGGAVRAKSPGEGQGATFVVMLPITVVHPEPPAPEQARREQREPGAVPCDGHELVGTKVLVVDDEPDARQVIRRVLKRCGAEVMMAGSAEEALTIVEETRPDVIVSDIGMPNQDGYDFIRMVRARWSSKELPAAALTAFARSEDRRRALLAGFQTHVVKPVDPAELVAVVASLAGRTGGA